MTSTKQKERQVMIRQYWNYKSHVLGALCILITSLMGLTFRIAVEAAPLPEREYWAVIVGVSDYKYIDDCDYADYDAEDLSEQLEPIFGTDHIKLLVDSSATKAAVRNAIYDWLDPREDEDDVVMFFFSGHGESDYISPHDALTTSYANDISANELDRWMDTLECEGMVVILDSCESGSFINNLSQSGRVILTSSAKNEDSWSTSSIRHGDFSYFLLEAISDFEVTDTNNNHQISAEEIFNRVKPEVIAWEAEWDLIQTPQIGDYYPGELVLFGFAKVAFDTTPSDTSRITVDGARYYAPARREFTWIVGTVHTFTVESMEVQVSDGERLLFTSWSDGNTSPSRTVTATESTTYIANFRESYLLTIVSDYGQTLGEGWYDKGSAATFSIASQIIDHGDGSRQVFTGWGGDSTATTTEATITMNSPKTVTASWKPQYYLTVESEQGDPQGEGWYDKGNAATFSIASQIIDHRDGSRHMFTGWGGDSAATTTEATTTMNSPKTVTASWKPQYYLTVESEQGNPQGQGWYDEGSPAAISVTSPLGTLVRQVFTHWSGDSTEAAPSASIVMNSPKVVVANWRTDYSQLYLLIGGILVLAGVISIAIVIKRKGRV
ncbi:hypothetical protein ES703_27791 [subsurface metagenome]